jgi:hypothetical protein
MSFHDQIKSAVEPIIEAHEYVSVLGIHHDRMFLGLTRMVTTQIATLIMISHVKKGHRALTESMFQERLTYFIPAEFLLDKRELAHLSWTVDTLAIAKLPIDAFEALQVSLGDNMAVTAVAFELWRRSSLRQSANPTARLNELVSHLKDNLPRKSLQEFFDKNTGILYGQALCDNLLKNLKRYPRVSVE